eukprot:1008726-Alexandrium_andersonii.AAC.1
MSASLVGSEMCIRDSSSSRTGLDEGGAGPRGAAVGTAQGRGLARQRDFCLLYTSDAADDM